MVKRRFWFLQIIMFSMVNLAYAQYNDVNTSFTQGMMPPIVPVTGTLNLKILLVEFADVKHSSAYSKTDFENLLLSSGIYVTSNNNMYSPDGDQLFGSLHDYYDVMSNGNLNIVGEVLTGDSGKVWVELDSTKMYYSFGDGFNFINDVLAKANNHGFNISQNMLGYGTKLVIIYAGNTYMYSKNLCPTTWIGMDFYLIGERTGGPINSEIPSGKFMSIGIHAHEFGHLFNLDDAYKYRWQNNGYWDLMGSGNYGGPTNSGECPTPISPVMREKLGWISPINVSDGLIENAIYSIRNPRVYKTQIKSGYPGDYFCYEYREFGNNMYIGQFSCPDYNTYVPHGSSTKGFLAWRHEYEKLGDTLKFGKLVHANGEELDYEQGVLFPGNSGKYDLSPWSDPRAPWNDPAFQYNSRDKFFVPNTKPHIEFGTAINTGFEIVQNYNGTYSITLYSEHPENISYYIPKNLQLTGNTPNQYGLSNVKISWSTVPLTGVSYEIYRRVPQVSESWVSIGTTASNYFVDNEYLYADNWGDFNCIYKVRTNITAQLSSQFSELIATRAEGTNKKNNKTGNDIITSSFNLNQNYPNPFNPSTNIAFSIKEQSRVTLKVYDILGKEVASLINEVKQPGNYSVRFDGSNLPSGLYLYKLTSNNLQITKKMLLTK